MIRSIAGQPRDRQSVRGDQIRISGRSTIRSSGSVIDPASGQEICVPCDCARYPKLRGGHRSNCWACRALLTAKKNCTTLQKSRQKSRQKMNRQPIAGTWGRDWHLADFASSADSLSLPEIRATLHRFEGCNQRSKENTTSATQIFCAERRDACWPPRPNRCSFLPSFWKCILHFLIRE